MCAMLCYAALSLKIGCENTDCYRWAGEGYTNMFGGTLAPDQA